MSARPSVSLDRAVGWPFLFNLGSDLILRPAEIVDLFVLVPQLNGKVKVKEFCVEIVVDNNIAGVEISVGDTMLVEICKAVDEARADVVDLAGKLAALYPQAIRNRGHLGQNKPGRRQRIE